MGLRRRVLQEPRIERTRILRAVRRQLRDDWGLPVRGDGEVAEGGWEAGQGLGEVSFRSTPLQGSEKEETTEVGTTVHFGANHLGESLQERRRQERGEKPCGASRVASHSLPPAWVSARQMSWKTRSSQFGRSSWAVEWRAFQVHGTGFMV